MYGDPSLIRQHVVRLRLNDTEHDLITAWVNYTGQQMATMLREMLLEQARLDIAASTPQNEGPQKDLFGT